MASWHLRTLGGLSLSRAQGGPSPAGEPLASIGTIAVAGQRKALALLAILAVAGHRGVARDRLLLLLWPDSDTERARGALKTMVHSLRRQLGSEAITGVAELRLGPAAIGSDVEHFRAAIAAGDDRGAVSAYTGPFLDGASVDGSPEFDRWIDDERAGLAGEHREALERLATAATRGGLHAESVRWWRARYAAEPLHAPTSLRLMQALADAGDRDGALLHARAYEALVRAELELPPDPSVVRLADALRARGHTSEPREDPDRGGTSFPSDVWTPAAAKAPLEATTAPRQAPAAHVRSSPYRRSRWQVAVAMGVAASIVAAVALVARPWAGADALPPALPALVANRVAVSVFVNRTGDPAHDVLGTMVADWVTRGLVRTPGAEVFDEGGLFVGGRAVDGAPVAPREMARANGAGLVVAGNYYGDGARITFSVQLLDVGSGRVLRSLEPVEGDAREPRAAMEEVRQRVASALATYLDPRLRQITVPPLVPPRYDAYTEFAAGQEIYWRGDWADALPHFQRAVALDSTFMAALAYVSVAAAGLGRCALVDSVRQDYGALRPSPTDADWLTVQVSTARCASDHAEHNRAARERLALMPGSRFVSFIIAIGLRGLNRPGEALAILNDLDPSRDLGWLPHRGRTLYWYELATDHHLLRDFRAERGVAERMEQASASPLATAYVRARALAGLGAGDSALAVLDGIGEFGPDPLLVAGRSGQLVPVQVASPGWVMLQTGLELSAHGDTTYGRAAMERAARWYESVRRKASPLSFGNAVNHALVLDALGRLEEARAAAEALVQSDATSTEAHGTLGLIAAHMGDRAAATREDQWLSARPSRFPLGLPTLYRAQIAAARGDTSAARAALEALPKGAHPLDVLYFHLDPTLAVLRQSPIMRRWVVPQA